MTVLEDLEKRKRRNALNEQLSSRRPVRLLSTQETQGMSEFDMPFELKARQAKTALGLLTTFDPKKQLKVIQQNYPEIKVVGEDEEGRPVVDATAYGGNIGFVNAPGISARDLYQLGFQGALFSPAGKAGQAFSTLGGKMLAVAGGSAVTQAGQDLASQSLRGEAPSISNIDKTDLATATLAGGLGEGLLIKLSGALPVLKAKVKRLGITNQIRAVFRRAAVEAGRDADEVTDDVIRSFLDATDDAVNTDQAVRLQGEREFGIGLTKGQRSGSQKQLSFEDTARSGTFGDKPQRTILAKESEQAQQARAAKERIQSNLGGDFIADQPQAGGVVSQGVKNLEKAAYDSVDEAYAAVGDAYLDGKSYMDLLNATKNAVKSREFVKSAKLAPASDEMLGQINKFIELVGEQATEIKPQHINQIESMRRTINSYIDAAGNNADRRTLMTMKRGFDDFLDNAVKNSLFSGDDQALAQLKKSRSLYSEYRKKFTAQPTQKRTGGTIPDKEGAFIEKIIADNPTDIQTINAIYGTGEGFGNLAGKKMAERMKSIVGPNSDEWAAIRQAGFLRLIKTMPDGKTISGQKTFTAIEKALKNRELMEEIFSKKELALFKRFAAQVKRTQPDLVRSRENPSGTAQKIIKSMSQFLARLGVVAGDPIFVAGGKGVEIASGFRAASRAKKAVRPFSRVNDVRPSAVGFATGASVQAEGS